MLATFIKLITYYLRLIFNAEQPLDDGGSSIVGYHVYGRFVNDSEHLLRNWHPLHSGRGETSGEMRARSSLSFFLSFSHSLFLFFLFPLFLSLSLCLAISSEFPVFLCVGLRAGMFETVLVRNLLPHATYEFRIAG